MGQWRARLEHSRAVRNAIALCNNISLDQFKDPEGGIVELQPEQRTKFDGKVFFEYLESQGHNYSTFFECKCRGNYV